MLSKHSSTWGFTCWPGLRGRVDRTPGTPRKYTRCHPEPDLLRRITSLSSLSPDVARKGGGSRPAVRRVELVREASGSS